MESARGLIEEGTYRPSRPPGYPLVEVLFAPLVNLGPLATNGLVAVVSALVTLLVLDLARAHGAREPVAIALAFACVPTVWVASVTSIDYLFGLGLALAALRAAHRERPVATGVLLGLALAARATSGLLLIPILLRAKRRLLTVAIVFAVGAQAYLATVAVAGWEGLVPRGGARPDALFVLRQGTLGVFGEIGLIGVLLASALALRASRGERPRSDAAAIVLPHLALYLSAPYEPEYLLPAVVGVLLWIAPRLEPRASWALAGLLLASSLVGVRQPAPVLVDHRRRLQEMTLVEDVVEAVEQCTEPTALLCGRMYPKVRFALGGKESVGPVDLHVSIANESRLRRLLAEGVRLRYVPGIEGWYRRRTGLEVSAFAEPLCP